MIGVHRNRSCRAVLLALSILLATAACNSRTASTSDVSTLRVLIPFPSKLTFYSFYVGQERGYFKEEGIALDIQAADGATNVLQQLVAGNADTGYVTTSVQLAAAAEGHEVKSYYVLAPGLPVDLVTTNDTGIKSLKDLNGKKIGISGPRGTEPIYVQAMLAEQGIKADVVPVGDAAVASLAFENAQIQAYASSTTPIAMLGEIFKKKGKTMVRLGFGDDLDKNFGGSLVATPEKLGSESDKMIGLARAFAKASVWTQANPEGALAIVQKVAPNEVTNCDTARALLRTHMAARQPTAGMAGTWGRNVPESWNQTKSMLLKYGELSRDVDALRLYTNDYIDKINDFDAKAIRQDAENYSGRPSCRVS